MSIDLKTADISQISKDKRDTLYAACESFSQREGFELFFEHIRNSYIESTLGLNEINRIEDRTPITDDFFCGWLDMLRFIKTKVLEYSEAKNLSSGGRYKQSS